MGRDQTAEHPSYVPECRKTIADGVINSKKDLTLGGVSALHCTVKVPSRRYSGGPGLGLRTIVVEVAKRLVKPFMFESAFA
jgi:hypothetical protein